MFDSNVLDIAIGLVFVYVLLSLLCSTPNTDLRALETTIEQFQPVIDWSTSPGKIGGTATLPTDVEGWVLKIVGLLATTFAVSLGAPFWFDVLNKFTSFRSSGSPPKTSTGTASK